MPPIKLPTGTAAGLDPPTAPCDSGDAIDFEISPQATLTHLIEQLGTDPRLRLKLPSISVEGDQIYMQGFMKDRFASNLDKPLDSLMQSGASLTVTDPGVPTAVKIVVRFSA